MSKFHTLLRKLFPLPLLLAIIFIITSFASACSTGGSSGELTTLTFGMEATAVNSLVYIAQEEGYFNDNGINLVIKDDYPSGAAAVEGMLKGEVDIATAAELAIVRQAFANQRIVALGSTDRFLHMKLIGRKDRGIQEVSDLKGKRIGVPLRSAGDFMFARFLDLNGIKASEVTIIEIQSPQAVEAMREGRIDAIVAWQPNVISIQDWLGENARTWDVQSGQPLYCVLVATDNLTVKNPDLTSRFLKSLAQAETYLEREPEEAKTWVQQTLKYDRRYIDTIWPEHIYSLQFDQSLILAMEDQARWMISSNMTTERKMPNFLDFIDESALKAVKPEAVSIIR